MDKIIQYADYIEQLLLKHAEFNPIGEWSEFENQVIIDQDRKHFLLIRTGWKASKRIHQCILHIDLKDQGKIWIQEDWTEQGAANELNNAGVPKEDIVLAFYAPFRREDTQFATA